MHTAVAGLSVQKISGTLFLTFAGYVLDVARPVQGRRNTCSVCKNRLGLQNLSILRNVYCVIHISLNLMFQWSYIYLNKLH